MSSAKQAALVSVVVPCYRDAELLADLLRALLGPTPSSRDEAFEVIVVDSGPDDRVQAVATDFGARCVRGKGRLLAGEARNLGADHARGSIVAFIDSDCVPEPGWIDAVASGLRAGRALIGGPVLNRLHWYSVASVDNLLQFADFGPDRPDGSLHHVPSCNMAMRREDFLALGGFEHRGHSSGEDVLLTSSVERRWPGGIVFVPTMRVAHMGRHSLGAMLRHHHGFGFVRGALGLHLSDWHRTWGRLAVLLPAVMLKRLTYVARTGTRTGQTSAMKVLVTLPLLLMGVLAWSLGFRRGLRQAPDG